MAELVFHIDDFSLTANWSINFSAQHMHPTLGYFYGQLNSATPGTATKVVHITGIPEGERVQKAVLTANLNITGDVEISDTETIAVNNLNFISGTRKMNVSEFINDIDWAANFYFYCDTDSNSLTASQVKIQNYSNTIFLTNVTLTLTTGTGAIFDGEISSLPEGSKIFIDEAENSIGTYSIIHHGYGDSSLCLLWRDTCLAESVPFNQNENSFLKDNYGRLDEYLNETFYNLLPEFTKNQIQLVNYPTLNQASYGTIVSLPRYISTPSIKELFEEIGYEERYGTGLDYRNTINSGENYWTRSINTGSLGTAHIVNASGEPAVYNRELSLSTRPCFCVLENQLVVPTEDGLGYTLGGLVVQEPSEVYLNGSTDDLIDLQRDVSLILSWEPVQDERIQGYEIWISDTIDSGYSFYQATQINDEGSIPTSLEITSGAKGKIKKFLKVKAITAPETEYLNSNLTSVTRSYATKNTNVHYYNGEKWLLAVPTYYNGENWKSTEGAKIAQTGNFK